MQLNLNPSLIKDLRALSAEWGVSPTATVRRALRERLQQEGLRSHQHRKQHPNYKPPMTHRTIRLTPGQVQQIDHAAHMWRLSRSATIRHLIDMSNRQPITHQHLQTSPSQTTERWSIRLTPEQNTIITDTARLLKCSQTHATNALITAATRRKP